MAATNSTRRHPSFKDLTGKRFGKWTVLCRDTSHPSKAIYWNCRCDCGTEKTICGGDLKGNRSKGCIPCSKRVHGMSKTSEYASWDNMHQRCSKQNCKDFPRYGAKGIVVCKRWNSVENFYDDMGDKPSHKHTIERVDNSKGYSCGHCEECIEKGWTANCKWATRREQVLNRSCTRMITFQGETLCLSDWSSRLKINRRTLHDRLNRGWSVVRALTEPVKNSDKAES